MSPPSTFKFISIAYSDLFGTRISSSDLTSLSLCYLAFGDKKFIEEIIAYQPTIVSGLAYGIDIAAHKAALKNNLPTIAVLAHGLDTLYPATHKSTAEKMLSNGGLLTQFVSNTNADRENFPERNKVVAAMVDAIIVVESKEKEIRIIKESQERKSKLAEMLKPLNKEKAAVMSELLESVQTDKLQSAFDKYLPAVLNNAKPSQVASGKTVLAESRVEHTGDKTAQAVETNDNNVVDIKRLAGLK